MCAWGGGRGWLDMWAPGAMQHCTSCHAVWCVVGEWVGSHNTGCQSIRMAAKVGPVIRPKDWVPFPFGWCVFGCRSVALNRRNVRCLLHLTRCLPHTHTHAQPSFVLAQSLCNLSINHMLRIRLSKFNWLWFCKVDHYLGVCVCVICLIWLVLLLVEWQMFDVCGNSIDACAKCELHQIQIAFVMLF